MEQSTQQKGGLGRGSRLDGGHAVVRLSETDAASVVKRIKKEAAEHPYRTIGVAAVAGLVLSSPVARALAGWAGMRMGWDILLAVLRERQQASGESRN